MSLGSYVLYFKDIFAGKTKFACLFLVYLELAYGHCHFAQISQKAGAGSWVTASTSLACFVVFILALFKGYRDFVAFDWWALGSAVAAIFLWYFTKQPVLSVILVTIIDAVGFLPTFRKGFYKPYEETISLYSLSAIKYVLGIIALGSLTISTWLFPASLVLTNGLFVTMVITRRKFL